LKFARQLEQLLNVHATEGYQPLQRRMQAATDYFFKAIDNELIKPVQEQVAELRGRKRLKKHLQTLANLKIVFVRKKQQLEQALQIVSGLTKGMAATELLSGIQEQKKDGAFLPGDGSADPSGQKPKKGDSHRISLELYKEGRSIADIALRRGLAKTTVESHLASFIPTGEIDIKELVPENKINVVAAILEKSGDVSLGTIKQRLGEEYTFGEIRAVMKWLGTPAKN
jgi:Helix-turn-helix domain